MVNWLRFACALLLCLLTTLPAHARPQVLVVIADHLTLSDVARPGLPALAQMRKDGQACLMSPGLAQGAVPLDNVYATLGAGDSITVGNKSQGLLGRTLAAAHVRAALIGNADGDDTGSYRPASLLLPSPDTAPADDGTLPAPTFAGGRRIAPARLWAQTQTALSTCDLVIVHDGDFARIEREKPDLLPSAYVSHRTLALASLDELLRPALAWADARDGRFVWLIVPSAPFTAHGTWDSLTPLLRYGRGVQSLPAPPFMVTHSDMDWDSVAHPIGQSDTTQTWGLIAARDIAPSLLTTLDIAPPYTMTGAPMTGSASVSNSDARLRRLDRITRLNQQAQNPVFWTLGFAGAGILFAAIGFYLSGTLARHRWLNRAARYGVRLLAAVPLAMLFAPLADSHTPGGYYAAMLGVTLVLAIVPSPALIISITALVLIGDGLTGTPLISHSLLSVYALSGIRFYGIGNEYMGVLIAGTLLLASSRRMANRPILVVLLFALVIFVLSFPQFGAKAGGAITATTVFLIAMRRLQNLPIGARHIALGVALGFGLVFAWAMLGHWLPLRHTHIDTAAQALSSRRFGYIAGVALRKAGLAVRVTLHPGTLMGLLGLGLLAGVARLTLRHSVGNYLRGNARFAAVWQAGLWGCVIAVAFNDSGIVAAILMLLCLSLTLLHGILRENVH